MLITVAEIPTPLSYSQMLGRMKAVFTRRQQIPDLKVAGPILSFLEAAARNDVRSMSDIFAAVDSQDLADATGTALDAWGKREGVLRQLLTAASGTVDLGDASFARVATTVFAGTPAPIVGSTVVNVAPVAGLPSSGAVYLSRLTSRYEGPIPYGSIVDHGTYLSLQLTSPTLRFHNQGETVILSQGGDRVVEAGSIVRVPRSSIADAVDYRLVFRATIPDGETALTGVAVAAVQPGRSGSVPAGAIREYASPPFAGATVTNPLRYNNGFDVEDDDTYRDRIRRARPTRIRGVAPALETAAVGVVSPDEGRRVLSASYVSRQDAPALLAIDDGTGYEERTSGVAVESILGEALGGERDLAVQAVPVAQAALTTTVTPPYALADGAQLAVTVGGERSVHTFSATSFSDITAATAYEVASSINADTGIAFGARTASGGTGVVLTARDEANDDLQVTIPDEGRADANDVLGLPAGIARTLLLYRNDRPLSKDGSVAALSSLAIGSWDTLAGSQTLTLAVDGTPAVTYAFTDVDFVTAGTGFLAVGRNTPAAWATVLQARVPGVTASTDGARITLTSNRGASASAALAISGGTLTDRRVFTIGSAAGTARDFTLGRARGQIRLTTPVQPGDTVSAGTTSPRAFLESDPLTTLTLASDSHLWLVADGEGEVVPHGLTATTPIALAAVGVHDWGARVALTAFPLTTPTSSVFADVLAGDWAVLWDASLPAAARGAWRVAEVGTVTVGMDTFATKLILERRVARGARAGHAAVALSPISSAPSRVLACGGWAAPTASAATPVAVTDTAEIHDPAANTWASAAPMTVARAYHSATALVDGRVLVVGGVDAAGNVLSSAEIYDPTSNTWSLTAPYAVATSRHRAVRLADGRVLVAGGVSGSTYRTQTAAFDPGTNTWGPTLAMATARARFGATLLPDGRVLATGGETAGGVATALCELFNPAIPAWAAAGAMTQPRRAIGTALVGSTTVIAVGDERGGAQAGTYAVYTIGTNTWGAATALPGGALFENKRPLALQDGTVLALLGRVGTTPWSARWNGATWTSIAAPRYADSPSREDVACVLLYNNAATLLGQVVTLGGLDPTRLQPTAAAERYDATGDAWSLPDAAVASGLTLGQVGVSIARTNRFVQDLVLPASAGYTASALAATLASARGLAAETRRTDRLRVRTTTHGVGGSVMLAATDVGAALGLAPEVEVNQATFFGAVESGPGLGTPDFVPGRVLEEGRVPADAAALVRLNRTLPPGDAALVIARAHDDGLPAAPHARQGRSRGFRTTAATCVAEPQAARLTLRGSPDGGYAPHDRVWAAAPFALGPADDLTIAVDGGGAGRLFSVPMYRRTKPIGGTYGAQITLSETDGTSLAAALGLTFSLDDFTVLMQARGVLFSGDAARSMVARYYLHGRAGERARVRIGYPAAPSAAASVATDALGGSTVDVRLLLPGGSARNLSSIRSSTRVGTAVTAASGGLGTVVLAVNLPVVSASRDGANETTLTLTLPAGVADHGLLVGDILYLRSTDPSWTSGNVTVTVRTATTIRFTNTALGTGVAGPTANIGTVSADPQGEVTLQGAGVVAGDYVRVEAAAGLPATYTGETFRVLTAQTGYVTAAAVEKTIVATDTTLTWSSLGAVEYLRAWQNPAPTATVFAASINALAAVANSVCPVTLQTVGSGSGALTQGTVEATGSSSAWVSLQDGENYVGRTVLPAVVTDQYQVVLKNAVSSALATGAGWSDEDVRLVPATPEAAARWLAAPASSGLFTAAEVAGTRDAEHVQIATLTPGSGGSVEVQGGLANEGIALAVGSAVDVGGETAVRVAAASARGLVAGAWAECRNAVPAQRLSIYSSGSVLSSWTADGYLVFAGTTLWTQRFQHATCRLHVERQGRYLAISDPAGANADGTVTLAGLLEGDYVELRAAAAPTAFAQGSDANLGLYRVVRVAAAEQAGVGGTIWIENALGVEETAEFGLRGIAYDSVLPGDTLLVSHDLWGTSNRGVWTVEAVGVTAGTTTPPFQNVTTLKVSVAQRTPAVVTAPAPALGGSASLAAVSEGAPGKLLKKVVTLSPDPQDGSLALVRLDTSAGSRLISSSFETTLHAIDKMAFPSGAVTGTDGYRVSVGLVGAVSRVIIGDPADKVSYPGYAAGGTDILVTGSVVRRVQISLLVRAKAGFVTSDLTARIREAVAAIVNSSPVGRPISISSYLREVQGIQGVDAVTPLSPALTASRDSISVAGSERPLVLAPEDVSVTYVTE